MKTMYLGLFLLFASFIFAQNDSPIKNDFKLSEENSPSTVLQANPKVFFNENNEYLSVWEDYRQGALSYYAQRFDLHGNKIGSNFKVLGYEKILFDDQNVFAVKHRYIDNSWGDGGSLILEAKFSGSNVLNDSLILLGSAGLPWCGTGWLGINYDILFANNKYLMFFNNNGSLIKKTFSSTGSLMKEFDLFRYSTLLVKSGNFSNGEHVVLWSPSAEWGPNEIPLGIYGTFFNVDDEIVKDSVFLFQFSDVNNPYFINGLNKFTHLRTIGDSLYQVFFVADSLKLFSFKFNRIGKLIGEGTRFQLPSTDLPGLNISKDLMNYCLTSTNNGLFDLFTTIRTDNYATQKYNSTIFSFDGEGNYLSKISDTTFSTKLNSTLIKTGDNDFLYAASEGEDIYLSKLLNFQTTHLIKLNDDVSGSNESNPKLILRNGTTLLSFWHDEKSIKGKVIGSDGTVLSEQITLPSEPAFFFSNGKSVGLEKQMIDYQFFNLELTLFDEDFNVVRKTMFKTDEHPIDINYNYFPFLTQNNNLLFLYATRQEIRAKLLDKELTEIKDILLNQGPIGYHSLKIFKDGDDKIILSWDNSMQKYDLVLNSLGTIHTLRADEYLGNDKFLSFSFNYYYSIPLHNGRIFDINDTTITNTLFFGSYITDLSILPIDENHFVSFYNNYGKMFMDTYSSSGITKNQRFKIADLSNFAPKDFSYKVSNGNIVFTWSDMRNGNYDVFAKVFKLSSITDIDDENPVLISEYSLSQNYPNPFNPSTTINYQIPTTAFVTLKVYDILGKVVATLVNEEKPAGNYNIDFNGNTLTSGIYFCSLRADNFIQNRKMILLK